MTNKTYSKFILILISLLIIIGCNTNINEEVKFNKVQWNSEEDLGSYPNREYMLNDLVKNHKIKGLTYHQVIDLLGEPANFGNTKDSIYYEIIVNYGYLDPKSGRYLSLGFNKDSIITGFKIVDWKNRHANE